MQSRAQLGIQGGGYIGEQADQFVGQLEAQLRRMMIEGLLAIQSGATSRVVRSKMESFVAPGSREAAA